MTSVHLDQRKAVNGKDRNLLFLSDLHAKIEKSTNWWEKARDVGSSCKCPAGNENDRTVVHPILYNVAKSAVVEKNVNPCKSVSGEIMFQPIYDMPSTRDLLLEGADFDYYSTQRI